MKRASSPDRGRADQRGIALVAAILLLLLTSVLAATFIATTTSERAISSNVHVAREALVSADAGVRVAQQVIANVGKAKLDSCATAWPGNGLVVTDFSKIFHSGPYTVTSTNPPFTASATVVFEDTTVVPNGTQAQLYDYAYTITATGSSGLSGSRSVQSQGILRLSVARGNFANFLVFTNAQLTPSGGAIWFSSGTRFDGRVHTNGEFRFAYQPVFQDLVTSVNSKAWYNNKGNPIELNANNNGSIDQPSFYGGFNRNQATITLPANTYNQQGAAMLSTLALASTPTNSDLNLYVRGVVSSSALPTDVYVSSQTGTGGTCSGGIYVQGTLDSLVMFPSGTNQVYRFRQGTTTTMITVGGGQTQVYKKVGSALATITTYTGQPDGSLYVSGSISNLGGPPRSGSVVNPALQSDTQLTITATGDIVVQRDVTYQDYNSGQNVLGLYSSGGSVRVGSNAPDDCNVDAYVMATGTSGSFTVDNYSSGSTRGTFHLRGGMVASYYGGFGTFNATTGQSVSGYNRDFRYDRRGFVPPYFPSTNRYNANIPTARTLSWKEM